MIEVNPNNGDWFFYVCTAGLVLLAIQKAWTNRNIDYYFRIFYELDLKKVEDEINRIHLQNFAVLYFIYLITLTLSILMFFKLVFNATGFGLDSFSFFKLLIGLSLFLVSKHLLHQLFLSLFTSPALSSLYSKNFEISNSFIGIVLLPLLFIGYYTLNYITAIVWIALFVGTLLYLYNLIKMAWFLGKYSGLSAVFILIYLCSVEILPVVWITAWLSNMV